MNYQHHLQFNIFLAACITLYQHHINLDFWAGLLLYSTVLTPDLDCEASKVFKLWKSSGLGFVWRPFHHRGVLHHPGWSPFILVAPLWIVWPSLGTWFFVGCVVAIEGHVLSDKVYSRLRK